MSTAHIESTEAGDRVTYSRGLLSSPEEWAEFQDRAREFFSELEESTEAGSLDRDPRVSSSSAEIRERELEELSQHRESMSRRARSTSSRLSHELRDHRGRRIQPREHEPAESEELATYSITVGVGDLEVLELAQRISSRLGEYGFRVSEELGSWAGELERCARVVFQGPEERAREILAVISEVLPSEELAHIAISSPEVLYEPIANYRPAEDLSGLGFLRDLSEVLS